MKQKKTIQSVARAINILRCFENIEEIGVTDIGRVLDLHKSTVYNLMSTLESYNILEKNELTGKYRLGTELFRLGTKVNYSLKNIVNPYLERLVKEYEETANMVVRDGSYVVYMEKIESPHSMRISTNVGKRLPMYVTAVGKAMLSSLNNEDIRQVLENTEIKRFTKNTITDKEELIKYINEVSQKGYAEDFEELEEGLICVASPIINHTGNAISAISISGPSSRMNKEFREKVAITLMGYTKEISRKMGYNKDFY